MSDTFIKFIQNIKNNTKGTVLGPTIHQVTGNLVEVKIFSLGDENGGDRVTLWNRLIKVIAGRPYKSLEPYTIRDSKSFYGRDQVIIEVLAKLFSENKRLVLIFGAPGAGKTSLIDAGVVPLIIQKGGLVVSINNYENPARSIQQALIGLTSEFEANSAEVPDDDDAEPTDNADTANSELQETILDRVRPRSLVLVLDQFELLFERSITTDQRRAFITDIKELFDEFRYDPPRVVIVARDEPGVKAGLAELQQLCPDLFEATVQVPFLEHADAVKAISAPLIDRDDRVQFESPELINVLANNLATLAKTDSVYPPHLQIVCCALYDEAIKKSPFTITHDLLASANFSQGIVARFLELRLDNQLSNVRAEALDLLIQLADVKHSRWVSPTTLSLKPDPAKTTQPTVDEVLKQMVQARLLYRHDINGEVHYGFIDAGMADRVMMLADETTTEKRRASDEMNRMWQAWLARNVYATGEQLDYISRYQSGIDFEPVQILYLLRSAIEQKKDAREWVKLLKTGKAPELISELDSKTKSKEPLDIATKAFAAKLISSRANSANGNSDGSSQPPFTSLAESAAKGPDDATRITAALALMSQDVGTAVGRIDKAIGDIDSWTKRVNRVKLRSAMVETEEKLTLTRSDRLLVFIWLVLKNAYYHDGGTILRITASGALCSGLLIAIWAGIFSAAMTRSGSAEFTVGFMTGALLGGGMALGLALIRPLLHASKVTGQFIGSPARAALIICTLVFGVLHWVIQLLSGSELRSWDSMFVMTMGFVFGGGIGVGVMTDFDQEGRAKPQWRWRNIVIAVAIFLLIPFVFIAAKTGPEPLNLAIVRGGRHYASNLIGVSKIIDTVFYGNQTTSLRLQGNGVPLVYRLASAVDGAVNGVLLILGFKLGVRLSNKLGSGH
jgi:hypothetical protein